MARCPFPWYGGKSSHLKWLLPIIDGCPHRTYVESFGGAAAVLLNKKPSKVEIYNDLYSDVCRFFRVLRDHHQELIPLLELTPYSREEFEGSFEAEDITDLERARRFFVRARQCYAGKATVATPGQWGYSIGSSARGMAGQVSQWLSSVDGLEAVASRLRTVQIECKDAIDIIGRYDTPDTLHYVDPPYLPETRTGSRGYRHEYSQDDHRRLLETLLDVKGKVVLSGYPSELYSTTLATWTEIRDREKVLPSSDQTRRCQQTAWTNFP